MALFDEQREDGFIPLMSDPWSQTEDETQPPVIAWGVWDLYAYTKDLSLLEEAFTPLENYLAWDMEHRDLNGNGLYEWLLRHYPSTCICAESGMDNSPRFDEIREKDDVDFSCFMANEFRTMAKIASALGKEDRAAYWQACYERTRDGINELLWDEEDGMYYDRHLDDGTLKKVKAISCFLPLLAGVATGERARRLAHHLQDPASFGTAFPAPSISLDDPTFGTDCWRGPVWINYSYMTSRGLRESGFAEEADEFERRTLSAMAFWYRQEGTLYEFYDAEDLVSPQPVCPQGA